MEFSCGGSCPLIVDIDCCDKLLPTSHLLISAIRYYTHGNNIYSLALLKLNLRMLYIIITRCYVQYLVI